MLGIKIHVHSDINILPCINITYRFPVRNSMRLLVSRLAVEITLLQHNQWAEGKFLIFTIVCIRFEE